MLWRVRTTMPDRPGKLAALARECGEAGVNIKGFQAFPAHQSVTDQLVLDTPEDWRDHDVVALLERSGGERVIVRRCAPSALMDQPTRYVEAARAVLAQPASFPDVMAQLFDAEVQPQPEHEDVMELSVGDVLVQIRRETPFASIERTRGTAMAQLVTDVLEREQPSFVPSGAQRMGSGGTPAYVVDGSVVTALVDGVAVGHATVGEPHDEDASVRSIDVEVDAAWQRRGIGARLFGDAARLARKLDCREVVLTTAHDNRAVMPMVLAAGMRGRIRMAGETLTVRISVHELRPLAD